MGPESSGRIGRIIVHRSIPTRAFDVLKDPSIDGSDADLMASTAMQIRIREDMRAAADMVNGLEVLRRQIEDASNANAGSRWPHQDKKERRSRTRTKNTKKVVPK